jgi:hypothetical protein
MRGINLNDESNQVPFVSLCSLEGASVPHIRYRASNICATEFRPGYVRLIMWSILNCSEVLQGSPDILCLCGCVLTYVRVCLHCVRPIVVPVCHLDLFSALFCSTVSRKI